MTARTQQTFDWPRASQLSTLDKAELPTTAVTEGRRRVNVSGGVMKAVLQRIDSHGRGKRAFPSQATLVRESCFPERQVRRALRALKELGVLIVERRWYGVPGSRETGNFYTIVWSELALYDPDHRQRMREYQSAKTSDQSAKTSDQTATGGRFLLEAHISAQEPPPPTPSNETRRSSQAAAETLVTVTWEEVGTRLQELGLELWADTVRKARELEYGAAEVWEACDWFEANRDKLQKPSAIRWWITHDRVWPAEGIRDPQAIEEAQLARAAKLAAKEAQYEAERRETDDWRQEFSSLNEVYGPEYDAMSEEQQLELAKATFTTGWEMSRWRRGDSYARYKLLVAIHKNRTREV